MNMHRHIQPHNVQPTQNPDKNAAFKENKLPFQTKQTNVRTTRENTALEAMPLKPCKHTGSREEIQHLRQMNMHRQRPDERAAFLTR